MSSLRYLICAIVAVSPLYANLVFQWMLDTPRVKVGTAIMPASDLADPKSDAMAAFVRLLESLPQREFIYLDVQPTGYDPVSRLVFGHSTYGLWRRLYDRLASERRPAARFLASGPNAVLELFNPPHRKKLYVRGSDPTQVKIRNGNAEIIHINFDKRQMPPSMQLRQELRATAFVLTDAELTEETGLQILEELRKFPLSPLDVFVRNDPWFIDLSSFPIDAPFGSDGWALPKESDFRRSRTLLCSVYTAGPRCTAFDKHM